MRQKDRITAFQTSSPIVSSGAPVSLKLSKELVEQVDELAVQNSTTRSAAISDIIRDAVAKRTGKILEKKAANVLQEPEDSMSKLFRGLIAFYNLAFPEGQTIDFKKLSPDLAEIHEPLLEALVSEFLKEMYSHADRYFLTQGSEAEIFRIHTTGGDFIIAKRRYDSRTSAGTNLECQLQEAAGVVAQHFPGVAVPKIFARIVDDPTDEKNPAYPEYEKSKRENKVFIREKSEYIVMECVPGKTIYTLLLETVANLGQAGQGHLDLVAEPNPVKKFFQARSNYAVKFDNDTEAEMEMIEYFRPIAAERGTPDPGTRVRGEDGVVHLPYLEEFVNEYLKGVVVFNEAFTRYFNATLRPYVEAMHQAGVYHRDLNVRNLMLGEDGNIYVIDFGKGIRTHGKDDFAYDTQQGKCDNDFSIIALVRHYGPQCKPETEADLMQKEARKARESVDYGNLRLIAFVLGLDPERVETVARGLNQKPDSNRFKNFFTDYAEGRWERLNGSRFIQANPRKPEAVAASDAGKVQLLAELFLADIEEVRKFRDFLEALDPDEYAKESKAKADRARKYRDIFLPFARAAG